MTMSEGKFASDEQHAQVHCGECEWWETVNGYAEMVDAWTDHLRDEHPQQWLDA